MVKMFNNLISLFKENGMKLIMKGEKNVPFLEGGTEVSKNIFCFVN